MTKHKFKVGDKVTILPSAVSVSVEREDVGKTGVIRCVDKEVSRAYGISVYMNEVCQARGYKPNWSVGYGMIKLSLRKGEQLEFKFMREG